MFGWKVQWYANVPAVSRVSVALAPGSIGPVSNDPSSAVTVWAVVSLLVIVIVVPAATDRSPGLNAKSWIVIAAAPAASLPGAADGAGAADVAGASDGTGAADGVGAAAVVAGASDGTGAADGAGAASEPVGASLLGGVTLAGPVVP